MPILKDAQVITSGTVIANDDKFGYDRDLRQSTKEIVARKLTLLTSEGGAAVVNTPLDVNPKIGSQVAFVVQQRAYDGNITSTFVRSVQSSDLAAINSIIKAEG